MSPPFKTIAIFGANGQMGLPVFEAIIRCKEPKFKVIAFVSPKSQFQLMDYHDADVIVKHVDLNEISRDSLADTLSGYRVDVTLSTLGGDIITKQALIQDASAKAKVKRFFPSEFGMQQVVWLPNGEAYVHPVSKTGSAQSIKSRLTDRRKLWALKMKCLEAAIRHPAITSGQMSYTVIGCGECWDCPNEPLLCPWLETEESITRDGYSIQCVGNPDAKMDYSSRTDIAKFYVATISYPNRSENKILGFRSDYISYTEIASLLAEYSGRPAKTNVTSVEKMYAIVKNPSLAPKELQRGSTFPVSFLMLLRYVQGQGVFCRPPGLLHNDLFPEVKPVPIRDYFKALFAK